MKTTGSIRKKRICASVLFSVLLTAFCLHGAQGTPQLPLDIKAQFGVEDSVLNDFAEGKKELEEGNPDGTFGLLQWFDRINKLMEEYEDTTPILQRISNQMSVRLSA